MKGIPCPGEDHPAETAPGPRLLVALIFETWQRWPVAIFPTATGNYEDPARRWPWLPAPGLLTVPDVAEGDDHPALFEEDRPPDGEEEALPPETKDR